MSHERYTPEEAAYRRGFSHGYEAGVNVVPENEEKIRKEIQAWIMNREEMIGAPGTGFANLTL